VEPKPKRLLLILADISGYTRFMLASQLALVHGQQVITQLIEAILREVEIPLEIKEIEGDAVFLYAVHPGDDEGWSEVCEEVGRKLLRFFEVFSAALVSESESTACPCSVCRNLDGLKLKIIVHSGEALLHTIGRFADISGVDVILAHRLLKNSVTSDEYILMTEPAYRDLHFPTELEVKNGSEEYEGFGAIVTFVHLKSGVWEQSREAFFTAPLGQMLRTTLGGGLREALGQFRTWSQRRRLATLKKLPETQRSTTRSLVVALSLGLLTPVQLLFFPLFSTARALARRRRMGATVRSGNATSVPP
jgi:class 3 adenylate cyclase